MLVINCGYPMRLAISKRDLLNKLVYRFPPTPQVRERRAASGGIPIASFICE